MTQTRTFLIVAWLAVATMLWLAWNKDHEAATLAAAAPVATQTAATADVPAIPGTPAAANTAMPAAPSAPAPATGAAPGAAPVVAVTTDVLRVTLDGGAIHTADVLQYPVTTDP